MIKNIHLYTSCNNEEETKKTRFRRKQPKIDETKRYGAAWCSLDRDSIRIFTRTYVRVLNYECIYVRMRTSKIPHPRILSHFKNNFRDFRSDEFFFSFFFF